MKKKITVGVLSVLALLIFSGCTHGSEKKNSSSSIQTKKSVKATSSVSKAGSSSIVNSKTSQSSSQTSPSTTTTSSTSEQVDQDQARAQEYYTVIKQAWQDELNYINSIKDPHVKQAVQTPESAAIFKSDELLNQHPEDASLINENLKKVLSGQEINTNK